MKRTIKLALAASMALSATSAFATNGDHLIGIGAKARGMGGVGIGMSHGAESSLANPAMITSVKGTEIQFGGTVFMPNVKVEMSNAAVSFGEEESAADMNVIPAVSIAAELEDGMYLGLGMWGTAGMGVDYRGDANAFNMVTNLQLMQFGVPVAYKTEGFSVAVMPLLQYGALDIDYSGQIDTTNTGGAFPNPYAVAGHSGVAQDLSLGYTLGLGYEMDGLTLGAVYKSAIKMGYKDVLPNATADFAPFGINIGSDLQQPAEIGVGASYAMDDHTVALDVKQIKWASAEGYKDFGWENQTVVAVGYEYDAGDWAGRVGYNYASNPIKEHAAAAGTGFTGGAAGAALNMFNLLGFPGIVESHVTAGGTYNVSKQVSFDLAFTYALQIEETYSMAAMGDFGAQNPTSIKTTHSQTGVSFAANFNF